MKRISLFLAAVTVSATQLSAQWDTIAAFNQVISDMKSFDGKLFIGGNFTKYEGQTCYWSAYYNGSSITRQPSMIGGTGISAMDVHDGELYAVGGMEHGSVIGVSKWDGSTWVNGGSTNWSHSVIYADGDDIYVRSDDGLLRKKSIGGTFQEFTDFDADGSVSCMIRMGEKLVFAGGFSKVNGIDANNIVAWDGSAWTAFGSGLGSIIKCMAVYKNELYVAGKIETAGGKSVNKIAKWDGSNWSDVGGGVTGTCWNGILDMEVYGDELYVVGDFDEMGYVDVQDVAKWNGSNWSSTGLNHDDSFVSCLEVYNNKLYAGTFDFDRTHIFKYTGSAPTTTSLTEHQEELKLVGNFVDDKLTLCRGEGCATDLELSVVDFLGSVQLRENFEVIENSEVQINVQNLAKGCYKLVVKAAGSNAVLLTEMVYVY